jgi:hypothetical protein
MASVAQRYRAKQVALSLSDTDLTAKLKPIADSIMQAKYDLDKIKATDPQINGLVGIANRACVSAAGALSQARKKAKTAGQ